MPGLKLNHVSKGGHLSSVLNGIISSKTEITEPRSWCLNLWSALCAVMAEHHWMLGHMQAIGWPSARFLGTGTWWRHQMETFPRYWLFGGGIHRPPVDSRHKGQWRGALMFSLICAWTNVWANNRDAGDLTRHRAHYDVTVMNWRLDNIFIRIPVLEWIFNYLVHRTAYVYDINIIEPIHTCHLTYLWAININFVPPDFPIDIWYLSSQLQCGTQIFSHSSIVPVLTHLNNNLINT